MIVSEVIDQEIDSIVTQYAINKLNAQINRLQYAIINIKEYEYLVSNGNWYPAFVQAIADYKAKVASGLFAVGAIVLPDTGIYYVKTDALIDISGINRLFIVGYGGTIKKESGLAHLFSINNVTKIKFSDLTLDGVYNGSSFNINANNVTDLILDNVESINGASGLVVSDTGTVTNLSLLNSQFKNNKLTGFSLSGIGAVEDVTIDNCNFENNGYIATTHGAYIKATKNIKITKSDFKNNYDFGLHMYNDAGTTLESVIIDDNRFEGNGVSSGTGGAMLASDLGPKDDFIFTNNISKLNKRGCSFRGITNYIIADNRITDTDYCLQLGDEIGVVMRGSVHGNILTGSAKGLDLGFLPATDATKVQISENIITGNTIGIGKQDSYLAKDVVIENNIIDGNTTNLDANVISGANVKILKNQGITYNDTIVKTVISAGTVAVDALAQTELRITLNANTTISAPTNSFKGQRITFVLVQDGTGAWTVTWDAVFKKSWSDTGNTASKRSIVTFSYNGVNWEQISAQTPYY